MMMKNNQYATFYMVRHGQTDWNVQHKIQGHTDIRLNETGEAQAKEIGEKFGTIQFDLAFSSDLLRAKRTADIILLEKQLAIETTKALRERNFGEMEGKPHEIFFEYLKQIKGKTHEERHKHKLHDGFESDEETAIRVLTFLRETAVANPGKKILITTHAGVFHILLVHLGIKTYEESDAMHVKNTGHIKLLSDGVDFFVEEQAGIETITR